MHSPFFLAVLAAVVSFAATIVGTPGTSSAAEKPAPRKSVEQKPAAPKPADDAAPAARWDFGTEETSPLVAHGGVRRDLPGPRPPEFPDFDPQNTAVQFDGQGAYFSFADPGAGSPFDFTNGDTITLEAWVNVAAIQRGENRYIVGKGRTGAAGFSADNQNWALRVRATDHLAHVSFVFATSPAGDGAARTGAKKADAHWHRWTSSDGFAAGSGWHHVAVRYRFGEPSSIRGWIDGRPRIGAWDMGGETREPPVVDDDAVWIGSSRGGAAGNSFRGTLDALAIHRVEVPDEVLEKRFHRVGPPRDDSATPGAPKAETPRPAPEAPPQLTDLPTGRVLVVCHENLPAHNRWLNVDETLPPVAGRWEAPAFVFPHMPKRYDAWGIRESWKAPVLVLAAADVRLPAGRHRFLLRTRGLSRLWVNDVVVVRMKPHGGGSNGHQPVETPPPLPAPGLRPVGYGDQEAFGELELPAAGTYRVVLETIVGGKSMRPEPGEMLVALQTPDGRSFTLLSPAGDISPPLHLTDADYGLAVARAEASLTARDDQVRRMAAASQNEFWNRRHALARQWAEQNRPPAVPNSKDVPHPIDAFVAQKIADARAASAGDNLVEARRFHDTVMPILRDHCFRCHGDKVKGGLRLNSRDAALASGDSGEPAVVPHDPEASQLLLRVRATDESERMPPAGEGLKPEQIAVLAAWIGQGAKWPAPPVTAEETTLAPDIDDAAFLRRATLDTLGLPPTETELREFLADPSGDKRGRAIDRLLDDSRFADHWVAYWQDVLAENPNMLKPSLNNTGPFRWHLYEALRDAKPLDRMVTELIMMRGSEREGGAAGFGLAADNDAPLAAKGHILATAFLGVELQCARCHDSPYHSTKQRDLFSLAAMLSRKTVTVPKTSTVAPGFFEKNKARESLIRVTLKPSEPIAPQWPFPELVGSLDDATIAPLVQDRDDARERLAAYVTAPQNRRFAEVAVNRIWKRLVGAGLVEPAHDWEGRTPSHPRLLEWLAHELVANAYDVRHVVRQIMTSRTYQRAGVGRNLTATHEKRFFVAPERRRLTAEQVVDSLFAASGQPIDVEEISFDPEGKRPANSMISLGRPSRAWMFATLSNERDRPSLSLPRAQAVTDVLEAFGWVGSRQNPRSDRETEPTVLQPGVLANSTVVTWVSRASIDSPLARLALDAESPQQLVDATFLRFLGRLPSDAERAPYRDALAAGFADRRTPDEQIAWPAELPRLGRVSWSNHLAAEANTIKLEMERRARAGSPPDPRLRAAWRETYEDFVWSLINTPEFVWMP